jgi:putative transposase
MKKRFSEGEIFKILREVDSGMKVVEACRKHGISDQTYYRWKSKYGGMQLSDLKKMKSLESENNKLKRLVADLSLENQAVKELLQKKW